MRPTNRLTSHPHKTESPAHARLALSVIECASKISRVPIITQ